MSALDDRIAALRQQYATAQAEQAKAVGQRDILAGQITSIFEALKEQFGVTSVAEAQQLLLSLDDQISAALDAAEQTMGAP